MAINNHSKYWFKRKRYGYGWTPVTWQGWSVIALYVVVVVSAAVDLENGKSFAGSIVFMVAATAALLVITRDKAPKPRWRWGNKPTDNKEEDW